MFGYVHFWAQVCHVTCNLKCTMANVPQRGAVLGELNNITMQNQLFFVLQARNSSKMKIIQVIEQY